MDLDDADYPYSWLPPADADTRAGSLRARGARPGGVPGLSEFL